MRRIRIQPSEESPYNYKAEVNRYVNSKTLFLRVEHANENARGRYGSMTNKFPDSLYVLHIRESSQTRPGEVKHVRGLVNLNGNRPILRHHIEEVINRRYNGNWFKRLLLRT